MQLQQFKIIQKLIGDKEGVYIPRILIEFFRDYQQAAVFKQLVFWSDKGKDPDGWVYKTSRELADEMCLSPDQVDRVMKKIKASGLIEIQLKKAHGAPTRHYRINYEILITALEAMDSAKSRNGNREIAETLDSAKSRNGNREIAESLTDSNNIQLPDSEQHAHTQNNHQASDAVRESTPKPPSRTEIEDYFRAHQHPNPIDATVRFNAHYSAKDWKINGEPIIDWQPLAERWWWDDCAQTSPRHTQRNLL